MAYFLGTSLESPYGKPGDELWVRETWQNTGPEISEYPGAVYRATDPDWETMTGWTWRPSIHMPRWAARLFLTVKAVRVERLQDISEGDAEAEGAEPGCLTCGENCLYRGGCGNCRPCYRDSFVYLWQSIYGEDSWAANPWVWVVEFERKVVAT
jgi:hypothetical protein